VGEYPGANDGRKREILEGLRNIGRTWNEIGCRDAFGDIDFSLVHEKPASPKPRSPHDSVYRVPNRELNQNQR
jgi:hypothetical protein